MSCDVDEISKQTTQSVRGATKKDTWRLSTSVHQRDRAPYTMGEENFGHKSSPPPDFVNQH
eukprot:6397429-Amphidinium_carterae.1